jgi:hypothetical protein
MIQVIGVNHIIAVEAALHGYEYGRSVQVRYAQVCQVGNHRIRGLKTEQRTELNSIGHCWGIHEATSLSRSNSKAALRACEFENSQPKLWNCVSILEHSRRPSRPSP